MPSQGWWQTLATAQTAGTALTAAATASCLPSHAEYILPAGFFDHLGKQLLVIASGRISCVITTPGTARFDVRFGATAVADTLAMPLNIVAKTNVNWFLVMLMTCRAVGTSANLMNQHLWFSEAALNTALPATGPGPGGFTGPFNTAPVVGSNFDSTAANQVDLHFTQTVATGSLQLEQYSLISMN